MLTTLKDLINTSIIERGQLELSVKEVNIDITLMDIKMPQLNDYEITQRIRDFNKVVIIIAQTAYALVGDYASAIQAGRTDYISKLIIEKV